MEFGEMKRNTSNWSNFGMLSRHAGLTASAALSCKYSQTHWKKLQNSTTAAVSANQTSAQLAETDTTSTSKFYNCHWPQKPPGELLLPDVPPKAKLSLG